MSTPAQDVGVDQRPEVVTGNGLLGFMVIVVRFQYLEHLDAQTVAFAFHFSGIGMINVATGRSC